MSITGITAAPRILATSEAKAPPTLSEALANAKAKAFRGGVAGAAAMVINVTTLMWMRTTVNFQYKYGMGTFEALRFVFADGAKDGGGTMGGIRRFYRGYGPAILQGPLSRFGDTAANEGMLALLEGTETTRNLPVAMKSVAASAAAAGFRVFLMPIDCLKTTLQVEGAGGMQLLKNKIATSGPLVLFHGWEGAISATFVGHYPWFFTRNAMSEIMPKYDRKTDFFSYLGTNAVIGFTASAVSDTISNSVRVLKTSRQTSDVPITYTQAAKNIIAKDGVQGLFFRGLGTKIISNGAQGLLFNVLWRYGMDLMG
uniref:ADP,ATP carrier protein n=1 Tax=Florenciella parvula TaxID=236787 RepID=A0A7S2FX32_9STRA|eukprot:CAMPEP_0119542710 /NCGR_PEP_ID=MMETSP1344-20130328/53733_1 /TAXON_ID=236787 /ORGANISM="Florenciella parvula, Strain CCMP2471" /LENGTH=312 /DNA_ID=CAMNT_0007586955 /DNA_START=43 /DNA_END=981 /DNA_ORIENTATION=-